MNLWPGIEKRNINGCVINLRGVNISVAPQLCRNKTEAHCRPNSADLFAKDDMQCNCSAAVAVKNGTVINKRFQLNLRYHPLNFHFSADGFTTNMTIPNTVLIRCWVGPK